VWYATGENYYGDIKEDKREGWGALSLTSGEAYRGEFKSDKPDGAVAVRKD